MAKIKLIVLFVMGGVVLMLVKEYLDFERFNHCIQNMKQIEGAVSSVSLEQRFKSGDSIPEVELRKVIKQECFVCPGGGSYVIPKAGIPPDSASCSLHGKIPPKRLFFWEYLFERRAVSRKQ